tara:strand:+ start:60 stop:332 length:273 start_codon:yes stop_codon:yes gene_type:complete
MIIKIGDTITDERGRTGTVEQIGIGTTKSDPAGELGFKAEEYDLDLNYCGSVIFGEETYSESWCYFDQIRLVNNIKVNEKIAKERYGVFL